MDRFKQLASLQSKKTPCVSQKSNSNALNNFLSATSTNVFLSKSPLSSIRKSTGH